MSPEQLRVVLADDHPVFRDGLRAVLAPVEDLELVAEATTGIEAVERAAELQPEVVVMDLQMPELGGIEATERIVSQSPHVGVLVLTMFEDDDSVFAAMRAGARGYLLKDAAQTEILRAIRAVGSGEAIFGPAVARRVIDYFASVNPAEHPRAFPELTERERELLELIAQGRDNAQIAAHLDLSDKTVRNHITRIFSKLEVENRSQAIVMAREAGFGKLVT